MSYPSKNFGTYWGLKAPRRALGPKGPSAWAKRRGAEHPELLVLQYKGYSIAAVPACSSIKSHRPVPWSRGQPWYVIPGHGGMITMSTGPTIADMEIHSYWFHGQGSHYSMFTCMELMSFGPGHVWCKFPGPCPGGLHIHSINPQCQVPANTV